MKKSKKPTRIRLDRRVGEESSRTYNDKVESGFIEKYLSGHVAEIGGKGYIKDVVPIVHDAVWYNLGDDGYNGYELPVKDETYDAIYSSHVLEHIDDYQRVLKAWYKALKFGGYMITSVPSQYTYEKKKELPSKWNGDHKRFYSPSRLLQELEESLDPNSYRIISFEEHFAPEINNYSPSVHSNGPYQFEIVVMKVKKPDWKLR